MAEINEKEHWAELYRRALFEEDRSKLPLLREQAHQAVQQRVRELWYSPTRGQKVTDKERHELHNEAYYLDLLRSLEARKTFGEDPIVTNKTPVPWAVDFGNVEDVDFNIGKSTEDVVNLEAIMVCKRCASDNQSSFNSEVAVHFPGLKHLHTPLVLVFPTLAVCLDCGFTEFTVPEEELRELVQGTPVKGGFG